MKNRKTKTRKEWLAARVELLNAEKEPTRRTDELVRKRQELPWAPVDKDWEHAYRAERHEGFHGERGGR
ncbi:MAG TPA: DUF899 family protein [Candidatus Acidoferrum sp.]|jgi:predicted dithiol-disulfide oxidoreductase (DUF899 family)|nr:DUF899 family protein [Candidatus Acidoferrum sp.]